MLLKVCHQSIYHYAKPVPYALQRLRLTPRNNATQNVHDWKLTCTGATAEVTYTDGNDNVVELIRHERNATEITVTAEGTVSTSDNAGVVGFDPSNIPVGMFLRETELTGPGEAISALASHVSGIADELERMHALMAALHGRMVFQAGTTDTGTAAESALQTGTGVCQDYAHIFITTARLTGIPARYVSGYLWMEGVEEQTASHAWAEVFLPGLGWVGFDAANDICPNEKYIRLASGLDYRSAAPVSGIRIGDGTERLAVQLKVEQ